MSATPCRSDGKGLGRAYDGVYDVIVQGPPMRWLIENGHLCDYRVFTPATEIDFASMNMGSKGDWTDDSVSKAMRKSKIVGDVVCQYMMRAMGKLGVVFATDVKAAGDFVNQFNLMGVPAALVTAKTKPNIRREIIARYARREIMVLVNVDLFGEGFDLPAIEVVMFARPTMSYALFVQQFGRVLRKLFGKKFGMVIDHVGNVRTEHTGRHALPDKPRLWTLERRNKAQRGEVDPDLIPMRECHKCAGTYEATLMCCPYCSHINEITDRSKPEHVAGDLTELTPDTLERLRGIIAKKGQSPDEIAKAMRKDHIDPGKIIGMKRNMEARQASQAIVRSLIGDWAGLQRCLGRSDSEIYKRFYWKFGIDVMSAQMLERADTDMLGVRINGDIGVC